MISLTNVGTNNYNVGNADNLMTTLPMFSSIKSTVTNAPKVGNHILGLMAGYHVRHRMATVLPPLKFSLNTKAWMLLER
jgi:hypothetical protein